MIGALWILAFTVVIGLILYMLDRRQRNQTEEKREDRREEKIDSVDSDYKSAEEEEQTQEVGDVSSRGGEKEDTGKSDGVCCGLHLVCEKDSLSPMSSEIEYYDDEELDRFAGRDGRDYTTEETDEFREVLMTLRPEEVSGWARSITSRRLTLPPEVYDELLLLINEQRASQR